MTESRFGWKASDLRLVKPVAKGDYVGHPFRGNQWTDSSGVGRGESGASGKRFVADRITAESVTLDGSYAVEEQYPAQLLTGSMLARDAARSDKLRESFGDTHEEGLRYGPQFFKDMAATLVGERLAKAMTLDELNKATSEYIANEDGDNQPAQLLQAVSNGFIRLDDSIQVTMTRATDSGREVFPPYLQVRLPESSEAITINFDDLYEHNGFISVSDDPQRSGIIGFDRDTFENELDKTNHALDFPHNRSRIPADVLAAAFKAGLTSKDAGQHVLAQFFGEPQRSEYSSGPRGASSVILVDPADITSGKWQPTGPLTKESLRNVIYPLNTAQGLSRPRFIDIGNRASTELKQFMPADLVLNPREAVAHALAARVIKLWSITTNNEHPNSHLLQEVARSTFGLKDASKWDSRQTSQSDKAMQMAAKSSPLVKAMQASLRGMYALTQEHFAEQGITHVVLHRGESLRNDVQNDDVTNASLTARGNLLGMAIERFNDGRATVTDADLYDGFTTTAITRPLSSWATSARIAQRFGDLGIVATAIVPVKDIIANPASGFGCLSEAEMVVLGKPRVIQLSSDNGRDVELTQLARVGRIAAPSPFIGNEQTLRSAVESGSMLDIRKLDPSVPIPMLTERIDALEVDPDRLLPLKPVLPEFRNG